MVGAACENGVNVLSQILKGLPRKRENQIHGHGFKGHFLKRRFQSPRIHRLSAQKFLVFLPEGLDPDADPGHPCFFQRSEHRDCHVVRMKLCADPLRDLKILPDRPDDLPHAVCRQRRRPASEIQAGDLFPSLCLLSRQTDLSKQCIHIAAAQLLRIEDLAVGTEIADAPAERNMDVKPQLPARFKGKQLVVFFLKQKRLNRTGQPHPGQIGNYAHRFPLICMIPGSNIF